MKISSLDKAQIWKVVKAALYVAASALIAYIISEIAKNPNLFGPLTPIVNVVLVFVKQLFTPVSK